MCIKDTNNKINTNKLIEGYYHQMHHLFVYNTPDQVCHNCILMIHAFSRVCTIILYLIIAYYTLRVLYKLAGPLSYTCTCFSISQMTQISWYYLAFTYTRWSNKFCEFSAVISPIHQCINTTKKTSQYI